MFSRHLTLIRRSVVQVKSVDEFLKVAKQSNAYIMQFTAAWCGPCKQLAPILTKKQTQAEGKWKLIKIDVDQQGNSDLCAKHQLTGVPTLVFVKDGKQVKTIIGMQSSAKLDQAIALLK